MIVKPLRKFQSKRSPKAHSRRWLRLEPLEDRCLLALLPITLPATPKLTWDSNGTTNYNAASQQFLIDATPLAFQIPTNRLIGGTTRDFRIDIRVDNSGTLVG